MASEENAQLEDWLRRLDQGEIDDATTRQMAQHIARRGGFDRLSQVFDEARLDAVRPMAYPRVNVQRAFGTRLAWPTEMLTAALAQARQWVADAAGAVFVLLKNVSDAPSPGLVLSTRSEARSNRLMATRIQDEAAQRQIEMDAYATDEKTCSVEVGVFPIDESLELVGIEVILRWGEVERQAQTNAYGIATFADVPRDQLAQIVIRVAPAPSTPSTPSTGVADE